MEMEGTIEDDRGGISIQKLRELDFYKTFVLPTNFWRIFKYFYS